jgi:hypothetical protein
MDKSTEAYWQGFYAACEKRGISNEDANTIAGRVGGVLGAGPGASIGGWSGLGMGALRGRPGLGAALGLLGGGTLGALAGRGVGRALVPNTPPPQTIGDKAQALAAKIKEMLASAGSAVGDKIDDIRGK